MIRRYLIKVSIVKRNTQWRKFLFPQWFIQGANHKRMEDLFLFLIFRFNIVQLKWNEPTVKSVFYPPTPRVLPVCVLWAWQRLWAGSQHFVSHWGSFLFPRETVCKTFKTHHVSCSLCRNRGLHRAASGPQGDRQEVPLCQLPGLQIHHHTPQQVRNSVGLTLKWTKKKQDPLLLQQKEHKDTAVIWETSDIWIKLNIKEMIMRIFHPIKRFLLNSVCF